MPAIEPGMARDGHALSSMCTVPISTSLVRVDRSRLSPRCWIVGVVRVVAIAPVTLWHFHLRFYSIHRARMGRDGQVYTPFQSRMNSIGPVPVPLFTMEPWSPKLCFVQATLLLFESSLCWVYTPEWPHWRLSMFVLSSWKQWGTLIVSIHWRLIKFLLCINPHDTRFTTFMPNAKNRQEKRHSVTGH